MEQTADYFISQQSDPNNCDLFRLPKLSPLETNMNRECHRLP